MDPQNILNAIKDYGAAVLSTISLGGIAAAIAFIAKFKQAYDKAFEAVKKQSKLKDEALAASNYRIDEVMTQNKALLTKIDNLTNDVYKLESEVRADVKGNGKN